MLLGRCDAIVYAEVESLQVRPVTNWAGYCVIVSELGLHVLDQPWGTRRGDRIWTQTYSLPKSFLDVPAPPGLDGCTFTSGDLTPPEVGSRGVFFLYGPSTTRAKTITPNSIFLRSVRYGFALALRDSVTVYLEPRMNWYSWSLPDLLRALKVESSVR